jgi:hypothetical protein
MDGLASVRNDFAATKNTSDSDIGSMMSAPSLAGVGIFFQQDSDTNEIFVKTIVKGGSADRSGVLRVGDVVVRVDHEGVEGQPLSTLRSQILGAQGTYVTLGFRRREGSETTYYDVPLMRGSPEYFESLKTTQPLLDEIERLKRQNSHLEAQRAQDAAELQRYRQHMEQQRQQFDSKFLALDEALARKDEEMDRLRAQANTVVDKQREADSARTDLMRLKESLAIDTRRAEETEMVRQRYMEDLKNKMEEERRRLEAQMRNQEQQMRQERRLREEAELRESRLLDDVKRRQDDARVRKAKEAEARSKFESERKRLHAALKLNEDIGIKLRDVEPGLARVHTDLYIKGDKTLAAVPANASRPASIASGSAEPLAETRAMQSMLVPQGAYATMSGFVGMGGDGGQDGVGAGGAGNASNDDDDTFFMA